MDLEAIKKEKPQEGLEKFQEGFLKDRLEELGQMRKSFESNDLKKVSATAHKWKGFCEPYGFAFLADLSKALEKSIEAKKEEASQNIISEMSEYLKIKKEIINK